MTFGAMIPWTQSFPWPRILIRGHNAFWNAAKNAPDWAQLIFNGSALEQFVHKRVRNVTTTLKERYVGLVLASLYKLVYEVWMASFCLQSDTTSCGKDKGWPQKTLFTISHQSTHRT